MPSMANISGDSLYFVHSLVVPLLIRGGPSRFVRTQVRIGLGLKSESRILIRTWTQVRKIPAGAPGIGLKSDSDQVRIGQSKSQFGPGPEVQKSKSAVRIQRPKNQSRPELPPAIRTSVRSPNPESECVQM